jgi:hypothetical protein
MFGNPACPKCGQGIPQIEAEPRIIGNLASGPVFDAVVATCPHCRTVLGVLNDPADTRRQIAKEMDDLRRDMKIAVKRR